MSCHCYCPRVNENETRTSFFEGPASKIKPKLFNWISVILVVGWVTLVMFVVESGAGGDMDRSDQYGAKDLIESLTR